MNNTRLTLENFIKTLINRLTDFDVNILTNETSLEELDLVSLDFVTIKVEAKNQLGIDIDLNALSQVEINTFGQLMDYLDKSYLGEK